MPKNELIDAMPQRSFIAGNKLPGGLNPRQMENLNRLRKLSLVIFLLALCFAKPLYDLARFAAKSDLYSHILLIPFVSLYLIWLRRDSKRTGHLEDALTGRPEVCPTLSRWASIPLLVGLTALAGYWFGIRTGWQPHQNDYLALMVSAFVSFIVAACFLCLDKTTVRAIAFPMAFLLFMVPFPTLLKDWIEIFFQHTSASAAYAMFSLSGMPVFRDDLVFQLPGMRMAVAQECSGIHSSLVLFVTSLLAGNVLLRSPWNRAALALAVIPLAIIRNGFRIFTIGQLCVHISPDMINSYIHRRGGPIFFVLSLVPFFLLLYVMRKTESRKPMVEKLKSEN